MNVWLLTAISATLFSSVILFISYIYIYLSERERYLKYAIFAWIFYILRFVATLLRFYYPSLTYLHNIILICTSVNSVFLYRAVQILLDKTIKRIDLLFIFLVFVIVSSAVPFQIFVLIREEIVFFFSGAVFIYTGASFLSKRHKRTSFSFIVGSIFIIWGIHKWDYPFLHNNPVFAVPGYLLGVFCSFTTALGIISYHSQCDKIELKKTKKRLSSLLAIPTNIGSKELFDRVLNIALDITESEYGYLYFFDEELQEFTLNTWSEGVHKDCLVINPQTKYSLEKTGYWGEAVRQRKAIIENNYSLDNEYAKGIPEGHVKITRFCSIPVEVDNEIIAVIGVANKSYYYTESDVEQLQILMRETWLLIENQHVSSELVKAKELAQESEKLKTDFLANINHELRTPLNGIIGMLGLIEEENLNNDDRQFFNMVKESADDLYEKIKDILMLSEITTYKGTIDSVFSLSGVIQDLIKRIRKQKVYVSNPIMIEFNDETNDISIKTDKLFFTQIINNLISNAVKFSSEGTVQVTVKYNETLVVSISDEGCGISAEDIQKIFDPFKQLEDPYTKIHGGMGVGLAIASHLCRLLNIVMDVESKVGKGSIFSLTLPANSVALEEEAIKEVSEIGTTENISEIREVLIVEDEAINRLYLSKILIDIGLIVFDAKDGSDAIEMLKTRSFDLVLLDIGLPKVSGIDVLHFIRSNNKLMSLCVYAVTAHSNSDDIKQIKEAGADGIINKPYQKNEILSIVNNSKINIENS